VVRLQCADESGILREINTTQQINEEYIHMITNEFMIDTSVVRPFMQQFTVPSYPYYARAIISNTSRVEMQDHALGVEAKNSTLYINNIMSLLLDKLTALCTLANQLGIDDEILAFDENGRKYDNISIETTEDLLGKYLIAICGADRSLILLNSSAFILGRLIFFNDGVLVANDLDVYRIINLSKNVLVKVDLSLLSPTELTQNLNGNG